MTKEQKIINKIKSWLQNEVDRTELYEEKFCENKDDFISYGRQECANGLLTLIKEWRKNE
jgi:hypothetical protein